MSPLLEALRKGQNLQGRDVQYVIEYGCIMYKQKVRILQKYQKSVLEELHQGHLDIAKMKAIARSFVYWKGIVNGIEKTTRNCHDCARRKAGPTKAKVHYWEYPSIPWERIHIDFYYPIFEHMFLMIVDAHSK